MSFILRSLLILSAMGGALAGGGSSTGAPGGSGGGSGSGGGPSTADVDNIRFANYTLVCLASIVVAIIAYRVILSSTRYIRALSCLNNNTQMYFREPDHWFAFFKEHLFYAPLFQTRHNIEMRLIKGWTIGVLPTRFQSIFLAGVIAMNVALCVIGIEWDQAGTANMLNHLRNRSGTLAVVNMIPLTIMAGRNNPLIGMMNISFDSFNLVHRWFGRIVVAETIVHTIAWTVKAVNAGGWAAIGKALQGSETIITGFIGTVAFVVIIVQASSVARHTFYELFLHLHILLVIMSLVALWYHLEDLDSKVYIKVMIGLWAGERALRLIILLYRNIGAGGTRAVVEMLPGEAVRVTVQMARPWTFRPGQYTFITIPSIGLWTSHPFSLAWSDAQDDDPLDPEKGFQSHSILTLNKTSMSAIIRCRDGFTSQLYKKTQASAEGRIVVNALVEGPYGGLHDLRSYGTVLLFAGGVGITHQMPFVRDLVVGFANGTAAARRVALVWIIQSPEHLEWIRPWMTSVLALDRRRDVLRILLFVTRPRSTKEIHSPSSTVQMFPGRPNVDTLVQLESEQQVGAMGVSVCGPGGLADDVRAAVRRRQHRNVDFVEESFSW